MSPRTTQFWHQAYSEMSRTFWIHDWVGEDTKHRTGIANVKGSKRVDLQIN